MQMLLINHWKTTPRSALNALHTKKKESTCYNLMLQFKRKSHIKPAWQSLMPTLFAISPFPEVALAAFTPRKWIEIFSLLRFFIWRCIFPVSDYYYLSGVFCRIEFPHSGERHLSGEEKKRLQSAPEDGTGQ